MFCPCQFTSSPVTSVVGIVKFSCVPVNGKGRNVRIADRPAWKRSCLFLPQVGAVSQTWAEAAACQAAGVAGVAVAEPVTVTAINGPAQRR